MADDSLDFVYYYETDFSSLYSTLRYEKSHASAPFKYVYGPKNREVLTNAYTRVLTEKIAAIEDEIIVSGAYYKAAGAGITEQALSWIEPVQGNLKKIEPSTLYGKRVLKFVENVTKSLGK